MPRSFDGRRLEGLRIGALVTLVAGASSSITRADDTFARAASAPGALTARMAAGPSGTRAVPIDWSAAHALVREFGVDSAFAVGDAALARALAEDGSTEGATIGTSLRRYADELTDVVALQARAAALPRARVESAGGVTFIRPGTGAIELPAGTALVVVDLRDLPVHDELDEILARAVRPALAEPVVRPARMVRSHMGPVDEIFAPLNIFSTSLAYRDEPAIAGSGSSDVPIVLLVGPRIGPQAASFAAALRVARRAWIAGGSVPLEVAESTWQGVGNEGLMVRTSLLTTFAPQPPIVSSGHDVAQGEIYTEDIDIIPDVNWSISLLAPDRDDLDLHLVQDQDGDGAFDQVLASSMTAGEESLDLAGAALPPGRYQVLVFGSFVAAGRSPFTLELERSLVIPLPDEIPADLRGSLEHLRDGVAVLERLLGSAPPALSGSSKRSRPARVNPFGFVHPLAEGRGELRAGLLIAHGVLRLFYPYFADVGDTIDERLLETLGAADRYSGADRLTAWRILRRFGAALHDGHQFVGPRTTFFDSVLPVFLEHAGARPLVRRSLVAEIRPGDAIVALQGRPIEAVYAEELERTSAATLGYRLDIADRYIYEMNEPLALTLEDPTGARRDVTVAPQPVESYFAAVDPLESDRPSGTLADVEAHDFYYFNLNTANTPSHDAALQTIAEASALGARGMILDMRGYPGGVDPNDIAARLVPDEFTSAEFEYTLYTGPGPRETLLAQNSFTVSGPPAYDGPIVLVTGPHAVSAAENFMQMLVGSGRLLAVVGRASAGTNGNITGLTLPGGFSFSYTGLGVRNPDGSPFHGIGIVPDHEVPIVATDLRDGIDRALLEAVRVLRDAVGP